MYVRILATIGLAVILTSAAALLKAAHHHRTRLACLPAIPARDYQYRTRSATAVDASAVALHSQSASDRGRDEVDDRLLFQFQQPRLAVDHCAVSELSLVLHRDGRWLATLRAEQNSPIVDGTPSADRAARFVKRNDFVVRFHCLGGFANQSTPAPKAGQGTAPRVGRPQWAEIALPTFAVARNAPQLLRFEGRSEQLQAGFDAVDRVEIEFHYLR